MNFCFHISRRLVAYGEGEVSSNERASIEAHLDGCARCHERLRQIRQRTDLMRQLPLLDPAEELWDAIAGDVSASRWPEPVKAVEFLSVNESNKESRLFYEEYLDLKGARIWTVTQGGGEALVLLHGGPGGHDQLGPVADMLDDLVQVHRYEQPGSGRSTGDPPYTVERWIDDLERLRTYWGHDEWIVAGHSFGAEIALAYAAAFPERARAIIYMSCLPAVSADRRSEEEFRANRAARIPEALRGRFFELRRLRDEGGEKWTPSFTAELSRIGLSAEFGDLDTASRHIDTLTEGAPPVNREVNVALGEGFHRHASSDEFLANLRQLERPVLVLHGERDLRPMWTAERLAEQLPNARLVRLPGGHFPWLEAPFELRLALRPFVSEIVGTNQDVDPQSQHL